MCPKLRVLLLASLLLVISAWPLSAAPVPGDTAAEAQVVDRRLYVGMWTVHFRDPGRGVENNWLLGLSWRGLFGATFVNTFGNRAYSAGYQGMLVSWKAGAGSLGLGYRVGLVTGYDERFMPLAAKTPVVPLVQPRLTLDGKRLGAEVSYSGVVASAGFNVRF